MEGVPIGAFTNGIGVVTVVLIVFWMLATNRLHTHGEFERMERDHLREVEDLAHDRDEWRAEGRLKDQQIDERSAWTCATRRCLPSTACRAAAAGGADAWCAGPRARR